MSSTVSPTIGDVLLTLREMGFTEVQIQSAVQAGHFSVPEAADWLLHGQNPRHKLFKQPQPAETAFAAFNPPKDAAGQPGTSGGPSDSRGCGPLVLRSPECPGPAPDPPPPLESRIRPDTSNFEELQRQRVAQEAKAERRQKKQERELVLKRIADDRKSLQEKTQTASNETSPQKEHGPEGHKLGGKVQTNVDNNCVLMIRLPSGESMRERFPADAPLRTVVEHISGRHPSLPPSFSLLQGFPRKRFGEAELACSLRSLGLTPNAALCIQATPPATPPATTPATPPATTPATPPAQDCSSPPHPPPPLPPACIVAPPPAAPQVSVEEDDEEEEEEEAEAGPVRPPPLPQELWDEAAAYAGVPGAEPPLPRSAHCWGRGQKLAPVDAAGADEAGSSGGDDDDDEEPPHMPIGMPRLPFFLEQRDRGAFPPRHQWPEEGNRLREAPVAEASAEEGRGRPGAGAAGLAAVQRLQKAAHQDDQGAAQGHPLPPKRPFRTPCVPSLCTMATQATVHLMTAPSMQYNSSLSCLTPELADLLLSHMSRERLLRPRTLELLFGCPLQKFVLNCYPYSTNDLLRQLRAFTALKHLSLVNSPLITDSGLSVLSSLVRLQHLNLASCSKLTDSCLQYIAGLQSLCFLSLDGTKVSDAGMVPYLRQAPACLVQLSLNQTAVTDVTLATLPTALPQLRLLSLKHTKVSDMSSLALMPNLQTLSLDGTGVAEGSLAHLAAHPTLSTLSVAGIPVADGNHALQIISGLKLTQLTLPGRHSVTDSGLAFLSRLTLLSELDLTDYTHVTDQGVGQLSSMTRLKRLSLSNTQVSDGGLPALASLQDLQELCLDRTAVTSRGVAILVTGLPHLQVLGLASTQVGDTVVRRGLVHCGQLLKLNLSRTRITDNGLRYLKHMHLAQVNLDGTGVTLNGIAALISSTGCSSVRASGTRAIPSDQVSDDEREFAL